MPNCEQLLKDLHDEGYDVGIISTRSNAGIRNMLKDYGLEEYVGDVCGHDDVEKVKPDPEGIFYLVNRNSWNRECVLIGDSLMDIQGGKNYGAYTVAYLHDPERSAELSKEANEAITDLIDLKEVLKKEISFTYDMK